MSKVFKYPVTRFDLVLAGGKFRPAAEGGPVAIGLYNGSDQIAQLFFHAEPGTMPDQDTTPAEEDNVNRFVKSHFLMSDYANVLGVLTSGKTVYCGHVRTPPAVWLTSDYEYNGTVAAS